MGIFPTLALIFIVLKLCNVIYWPWYIVLIPVYLLIDFYMVVFGGIVFIKLKYWV